MAAFFFILIGMVSFKCGYPCKEVGPLFWLSEVEKRRGTDKQKTLRSITTTIDHLLTSGY